MAQLRQDYPEFVQREAEILVICPENLREVSDFWQRERMPFAGLADPGHKVANLYGQEVSFLKLGRMPSLVVLDREGIVRFVHRAAAMSDIPQSATVLAVLDRLNEEHAATSRASSSA